MKIGIDPGLTGAIAILSDTDEFIAVHDMPVMLLSNKKNQVNSAELAKIISNYSSNKCSVILEKVSAMPGQGVSSMFSFGQSFGIILGIAGALGIPVNLVTPASWKKRAGLIGKEKDYARTLAQQLYPSASLSRKGDIGRADAILIARFGPPCL